MEGGSQEGNEKPRGWWKAKWATRLARDPTMHSYQMHPLATDWPEHFLEQNE